MVRSGDGWSFLSCNTTRWTRKIWEEGRGERHGEKGKGRTRGERKKDEMKASRGGNVLEQGHKVGPSTFIFTVNIFISVFHVVAVKVQKENKIELKLYDVDILLLYTHNVRWRIWRIRHTRNLTGKRNRKHANMKSDYLNISLYTYY